MTANHKVVTITPGSLTGRPGVMVTDCMCGAELVTTEGDDEMGKIQELFRRHCVEAGISVGDLIFCYGCGAQAGVWPANPIPARCGECPPWVCEDCGEMDSAARHCRCWISFDGMALADIKGYLALGDLSLEVQPDGTR